MRRLLIVVVVVLGLAFAADRGSVILAQRQLAHQIQRQEGLDRLPTVRLRGFPFLTQAVRGRYDGGVIGLQHLHTDRLPVQRLTVNLHDVRLPARSLLSGSVDAVPVGQVSGEALVAYADLAAATGIAGLQIRPRDGRLELSLPLQQFGQSTPLVVSARIAVTSRGLHITAGRVTGAVHPPAIIDLALAQLSGSVPLDHLPYGLRLTGVRMASAGLELTATAHDVVLRRAAGA